MSMILKVESFIDESIKVSKKCGWLPIDFVRMRQSYGTVEAIRKCVESSEPKSGFIRAKKAGILKYTLEAAVVNFPACFRDVTLTYAKARRHFGLGLSRIELLSLGAVEAKRASTLRCGCINEEVFGRSFLY